MLISQHIHIIADHQIMVNHFMNFFANYLANSCDWVFTVSTPLSNILAIPENPTVAKTKPNIVPKINIFIVFHPSFVLSTLQTIEYPYQHLLQSSMQSGTIAILQLPVLSYVLLICKKQCSIVQPIQSQSLPNW